MAHSIIMPELGADAKSFEVASAVEMLLIVGAVEDSGQVHIDADENWELTVEGDRIVASCGSKRYIISVEAEEETP